MKFNRRRRRERRSSPLRFLCLLLFIIRRGFFPTLLAFCLLAFSCAAQVQEAWIQRYNGGFANLDHRPVAMAMDISGNIYVAGSSQSTSSNYDYVVLKYSADGTRFWAARYGPTNAGTNTVSDFALDQNGNTYVTGSGGTVKFGASGTVAWVAPYAGSGIAVDTNGNVYVTGLSDTNFVTVRLDSSGANVWLAWISTGTNSRNAGDRIPRSFFCLDTPPGPGMLL